MLSTLLVRVALTLVCFITGILAFDGQSFAFFVFFCIFTGVLGCVIFVSHCTANEMVSWGFVSGGRGEIMGVKPRGRGGSPLVGEGGLKPTISLHLTKDVSFLFSQIRMKMKAIKDKILGRRAVDETETQPILDPQDSEKALQ